MLTLAFFARQLRQALRVGFLREDSGRLDRLRSVKSSSSRPDEGAGASCLSLWPLIDIA